MIRDCFVNRQLGSACHTANEAGLNLPEHLMRSPAVAREIEPLEGAPCFSHKVIGERLIVLHPMTKHKGATKEHYPVRSSLNRCRAFSKAATTEYICDLVDRPTG